jgi:hypothetical protein
LLFLLATPRWAAGWLLLLLLVPLLLAALVYRQRCVVCICLFITDDLIAGVLQTQLVPHPRLHLPHSRRHLLLQLRLKTCQKIPLQLLLLLCCQVYGLDLIARQLHRLVHHLIYPLLHPTAVLIHGLYRKGI